eukprot:jgi/Botrbrau1/7638/Bobra.0159s0084.1
MSSESSQAHSLATTPRASGSQSDSAVRLNRSSNTTTFSFPFFSIASRFADIGSSLSRLSGVGHADGRAGNSSGTARYTLRVTTEVEPVTLGAQSSEESARRRGDLPASRATLRHTSPLRNLDHEGGSASHSSDEDHEHDEETTAAAAERHRLTTGIPGIDLQALTIWVEKSFPFLLLLLLIFIYKHGLGIFLFTAMGLLLYNANDTIRKIVAVKEERRTSTVRHQLAALAGGTVCHCALWLILTHRQELWRNLLPLPLYQDVNSVWDCIFRVTTVDFIARFAGILIKVFVVALHPALPEDSFRRRGQILTATEHSLLFYRSLLPIPVWMKYFNNGQMWRLAAWGVAGLYLILKLMTLKERAFTVVTAIKAVLRREAAFGQYATNEEVMEGGNVCTICQDPMTTPVKLHCKHMFCNSCITEWLTREPTCPMCRAEIRPAGLRSFGDGATALLPQVF